MDWNSEYIADLVRRALGEDIGSGDATTEAVVPPQASARAHILARQTLVCAGLPLAENVFRAVLSATRLVRARADEFDVGAQRTTYGSRQRESRALPRSARTHVRPRPRLLRRRRARRLLV